jgi:nitrate reductase assembly molybdenum cofactor insertion protein NarJ
MVTGRVSASWDELFRLDNQNTHALLMYLNLYWSLREYKRNRGHTILLVREYLYHHGFQEVNQTTLTKSI